MADVPPPIVPPFTSPTGTPVIPPKAVPLLSAVPAVLTGVALVLPQHTVLAHILPLLASGLMGLLGILSPGWRK